MKENSPWFLAAAMVAAFVGCISDTGEGDDPSPPENEAPPVSTSGSSVELRTTCVPQKIPVCGPGEVLVCSGTGTCRRCSCTW